MKITLNEIIKKLKELYDEKRSYNLNVTRSHFLLKEQKMNSIKAPQWFIEFRKEDEKWKRELEYKIENVIPQWFIEFRKEDEKWKREDKKWKEDISRRLEIIESLPTIKKEIENQKSQILK